MPIVFDDVRKLATVEEITKISPIEGADSIEKATVRGWTVVVRKGEFHEGDRVVYFEEDTALPLSDERFAFLEPRGVKIEPEGKFHVLKIARLRGVYSQGFVLPFDLFYDDIKDYFPGMEEGHLPVPGVDITIPLGLGKWEPDTVSTGSGDIAGAFLTRYARKTDSERVQNLVEVWDTIKSIDWDATEKIDGTSATVVKDDEGILRVMGRNWEIADGDNLYWSVVREYSEIFDELQAGDAVQFEIAGPGIQKNRLDLGRVRPFIFDYAKKGVMTPRDEWPEIFIDFAVPVIENFNMPETLDELISRVDGMKSLVSPKRLAEGLVFHTSDGRTVDEVGGRNTFKVISGKFLLKG